MQLVGIERPEEFRQVTRAHVIAWRKDLEGRELAPTTIRRKLSALSSLFDDLCERNGLTTPSRNLAGSFANVMDGWMQT